ncbi:hypothetical protein H2203_007042 [Taxawa tesnikishii (nom. ined.)]|nr:hypothetical protein H2203_007042 [Dothideales sp. JES 119]
MQYYFARTGLLDGKGAQLAREKRKTSGSTTIEPVIVTESDPITPPLSTDGLSVYGGLGISNPDQQGFVSSPTDMHATEEPWNDSLEPMMLPPTVSTYKHKEPYLQPLPDMPVLRRELRETLEDARKLLEESNDGQVGESGKSSPTASPKPSEKEKQGWYEVQGMHMLDIVTLAIRAAKNYYTSHTHPQKLYAVRSEREIRSDLYQVLEILKRTANREFRGGIRQTERQGILGWIESIHTLLSREEEQEREERVHRNQWQWQSGHWEGREREREWLFLNTFDTNDEPLPQWTELPEDGPSPFLEVLSNGLRLVCLHNEIIERSKRRFNEVKTFHTDTAKPYRCADNLRYWIKAAELRWEIKLTVNVMDVVTGKDAAAWKQFDEAVLVWCKGVREEFVREWAEAEANAERRPPELLVQGVEVQAEH